MARHTLERADHLEFGLWLIFDRDGSVRITRTEPIHLSRYERAVSLTARLPKSLWDTPAIRAELTITSEGCASIDLLAVSDAVRSVIGVDIDLHVTQSD